MVNLLRPSQLNRLVTRGCWLLGIGFILREIVLGWTSPPASPGGWSIVVIDLLLKLVGLGILGALSGALLSAIERVESDRILENERWERLFQTLESVVMTGGSDSHPSNGRPNHHREEIDAIRQAARRGAWDEADQLLEALKTHDEPDSETEALSREIADRRRDDLSRKRERIEASKEVNDSETVLALFEEVVPFLDPPDRKALEEDLARWFMSLIQRRLRVGTIQPEVVALITRVTELFGTTLEGASLRAGLPTLRRTVGLCPRCGGPYVGVSDACTDCLERSRA